MHKNSFWRLLTTAHFSLFMALYHRLTFEKASFTALSLTSVDHLFCRAYSADLKCVKFAAPQQLPRSGLTAPRVRRRTPCWAQAAQRYPFPFFSLPNVDLTSSDPRSEPRAMSFSNYAAYQSHGSYGSSQKSPLLNERTVNLNGCLGLSWC